MVKAGQVYGVWDMYSKHWHVWLMLRPCTKKDTLDYKSDVELWLFDEADPCAEYWLYVDLATGNTRITVDNVMSGWERL